MVSFLLISSIRLMELCNIKNPNGNNKRSFISFDMDLLYFSVISFDILFNHEWAWLKIPVNIVLCFTRHGVKVGPVLRDPGPREPGTSGPSSKFKSGTRNPPPQSLKVGPQDPLQNLKVGSQDPLQSLKVGPPHLSLMNWFFFRIFNRFLSWCLF